MSRSEAFYDSLWHRRGADPVEHWSGEQAAAWKGLTKPSSDIQMPIHEARKYVAGGFEPWDKFKETEGFYIHGLRRHIEHHGIEIPLRIQRLHKDTEYGQIEDGHHRLAAAEAAGLTHVPVRFFDHRGDPVKTVKPWREMTK